MPDVSISAAEELFRKAIEQLEQKQYQQCISILRSAMDTEKQTSNAPRMKHLSYLGLALTFSQGRSEEGQKLCEQAVKREFYDADLFCNLGIVSLRNRRRKQAFEAFRKGLVLRPKHPRILEELDRHDRRQDAVFPAFPRNHLVNRIAGKMRHRFRLLFGRDSLASD